MKKCVFAGTFDPFTVGHEDTVRKALTLFDEVVIAVAENRKKQCLFSIEERAEMIRSVFEGEPRVKVVIWEGVIVGLLKKEHTPFYVRGIRNTVDLEYETADFYASRDLDSEFVELFIPAEQQYRHISSTLVKNAISFGTDFSSYVPEAVYTYIKKRNA